MSPMFLCFVYILCTPYMIQGYHLSLSIFEWKNASRYCQDYCNSHLASMHNEAQYFESIELIDRNSYIYKDVWIGLNDINQANDWVWSDSTPLDYGGDRDENNYIISGMWPWRSGEPDHDAVDDCVVIDVAKGSQWSDRQQVSNNHFLCGSCSGKLIKYAAINGFSTYLQASKVCEDTFGTGLASIHSIRDMEEARTSCQAITDGAGCWIGLNDKQTRHKYKWDDGTQWDFGTSFNVYPWYYSQPGLYGNQYCIQIDPDPEDYLWDDSDCNDTARTLCNAPSEICMESQFFIANGTDNEWIFSKKPCEVNNILMNSQSTAIIGDKQYFNNDGILVIDMMFTIHQIGMNGNAGIAMHLDENHCNNNYVVGIWPSASLVYFGKFVEGNWKLIQYAELGFVYNTSTYYSLQVELVDGIVWNVRVNDVLLLSEMDDTFNNSGNTLSGYIGIRNSNTSLSVKSLYISGDVRYFDSKLLYLSCNNISLPSPTMDPTTQPQSTATPTRVVYKIEDEVMTTRRSVTEIEEEDDIERGLSELFNHFQLFWIAGVPAGILMVCAVFSWFMNTYCCHNEEDSLGGNQEGRRYIANV